MLALGPRLRETNFKMRSWSGGEHKWIPLRRPEETIFRLYLARHSPTSCSSEINFGVWVKNMNCNHNLSIHSLYLFVNIIKPDRFGLSIDLILGCYKIKNTNKVMNKTNTNSSLLKLLILSVFMCKYVNFCIFDFLFQLTLTRFISTMHSGAFDKIIFNKIYEKMDLRIRSINTRGLGDKFKRRQIFNWLKCKKKNVGIFYPRSPLYRRQYT